MTEQIYSFGPYRLSLGERALFCGRDQVHLTPTEFEILKALAHTRAPLTRHNLIDEVWTKDRPANPEANLYQHLSSLKRKLRFNGQTQSCIRNIHGRGYVLAMHDTLLSPDSAVRVAKRTTDPFFVGRNLQLADMWSHFRLAASGKGRIVTLTGEVGIGKTTFMERFLNDLNEAPEPPTTASGACFHRFGKAGAYLPLIDALSSFDGPRADQVREVFSSLAPSWHQLIQTSGDPEPKITNDRLLRELVHLLRSVADFGPVVIWLDDLQWADISTVEALNYLGGQIRCARVFVVVSYRNSQMRLERHPFLNVLPDLQSHHLSWEVPLGSLHPDEVKQYIDARFPGNNFVDAFSSGVFALTEGIPLFLSDIAEHLVQKGLIRQEADIWTLASHWPEVSQYLPNSTSAAIAHKLHHVDRAGRLLLSAAAVQGIEFDSAIVAKTLGRPVPDVEEGLISIEWRHTLIRSLGRHELPDGTRTLRFRFGHILYHAAIYDAVSPARRSLLASSAAEALIAHYGLHRRQIAGRLADLFESAGQYYKAVDCLLEAARIASALSAYQQVELISVHAKRLMGQLTQAREARRMELEFLHLSLVSVISRKGFRTSEIADIRQRIKDIAIQPDGDPAVLRSLFFSWISLANYNQAYVIAGQLAECARSSGDDTLLVQALFARGVTRIHQGRPREAIDSLSEALTLHCSDRIDNKLHLYHIDPGVTCLFNRARALWLTGYPERSCCDTQEGLRRAEKIGHGHTLCYAFALAADMAHHCGETALVLEHTEKALTLAEELGLPRERMLAEAFRGWALAETGEFDEAMSLFGPGVLNYTGPAASKLICLMAQVLAKSGRVKEGINALRRASEVLELKDERYFEAEIYRVKGELVLQTSGPRKEAIGYFRQAIQTAERQGARSLKLRAALSLARCAELFQTPNPARELEATYLTFEEGFDTRDLQEARIVLQRLGRLPVADPSRAPRNARQRFNSK